MPTANNLNDSFIGHLDLSCDEEYINKKRDYFPALRKEIGDFKALYCSPLKRAYQTASNIFPEETSIIDDRLIERDLGEWSNMSKEALRNSYPEAFYNNGRMKFSYTPPNGESFDSLLQRVESFLNELIDIYEKEDKIVVITHNGVITAVKCLVSGETDDTSNISFQPYLEPFLIEVT